MSADLQPDELEVLQAEMTGPEPAARVVIAGAEGVVRTQSLPRKQGGTRTRTITTTPQLIMSADPARASVTLISTAAFLFCFSASAANDPSTMAAWPANVPYVCTATVPIYAASAATTTPLTIVTEMWATGK